MDSLADKPLPVLTEADVLSELHALLAHGFGRIEVVIREGYIQTISPTFTHLGTKPQRQISR